MANLIPRVGFVDQQDTNLLLPPNDILTLTGLAEDDLPLVSLEQHVSVNGREWQRIPLDVEEATRVTTSWVWDLLELNLKSGDLLTVIKPPAMSPMSNVVPPRSQQTMFGKSRKSAMNLPPSNPPTGPETTASHSFG